MRIFVSRARVRCALFFCATHGGGDARRVSRMTSAAVHLCFREHVFMFVFVVLVVLLLL
eukprot:m.254931 g.254931  ORF g.254931 m.254931 type:complete len:59 (-) comp19223_c0_seq1:268-444(-)